MSSLNVREYWMDPGFLWFYFGMLLKSKHFHIDTDFYSQTFKTFNFTVFDILIPEYPQKIIQIKLKHLGFAYIHTYVKWCMLDAWH